VPKHNQTHTLLPARLLDNACITGGDHREPGILKNSFPDVGKPGVTGHHYNSVSFTLPHFRPT
jgi:hypothetical protein